MCIQLNCGYIHLEFSVLHHSWKNNGCRFVIVRAHEEEEEKFINHNNAIYTS